MCGLYKTCLCVIINFNLHLISKTATYSDIAIGRLRYMQYCDISN